MISPARVVFQDPVTLSSYLLWWPMGFWLLVEDWLILHSHVNALPSYHVTILYHV